MARLRQVPPFLASEVGPPGVSSMDKVNGGFFTHDVRMQINVGNWQSCSAFCTVSGLGRADLHVRSKKPHRLAGMTVAVLDYDAKSVAAFLRTFRFHGSLHFIDTMQAYCS